MTYTTRSNKILTALKSLQDDLYNEHHDINDMITELGGNGLQVRELKNEYATLIELKEEF